MLEYAVYVSPTAERKWRVTGGKEGARLFDIREHALAFGRTLAYSTRSELIVIEENGSEVLQTCQRRIDFAAAGRRDFASRVNA